MKNTGPRFGGAITAALFLQKFVQKELGGYRFRGLWFESKGASICMYRHTDGETNGKENGS